MDLLSQKDIAERAGLSVLSVKKYRLRGTIPQPDLVLDNKPLWKSATVDRWLRERETVHDAEEQS